MVTDNSAEKIEAALIAGDDDDRLVLISVHDWIKLLRAAAIRELQQKKKAQNSGTSSSLERDT
jgi:hypothetical protein